MKFLTKTLSFFALVLVAANCSQSERQLRAVQEMMTGSFSSAAQAAQDSAYFDISLHMYPIWQGAHPGHWLYVEQAVSQMQDRPYRQRVYELRALEDGKVGSFVYELPEPDRFVGKWRQPEAFDSLAPADLLPREGCEVVLAFAPDGTLGGQTRERACASELRGASFATSRVSISPGKVESWDQGFDLEGNQVWGAEKGPYVFLRQN